MQTMAALLKPLRPKVVAQSNLREILAMPTATLRKFLTDEQPHIKMHRTRIYAELQRRRMA